MSAGPSRVVVQRDRCAGTGNCVFAAPEVFDQHPDDGRVVLLDPDPPRRLDPALQEAIDVCPVQAITLART
ncbi:ferredoxin [Nocardia sp. NPDC050175]|uniref:ferredoxin n=1 Tax=Nocardia sp. NPDC050175 TaxID=3364317 RepID=UPI0037B4D3C5